MSSLGSPSPFLLGGKKSYEIERSLRFNDDDNTYLSRTPSSAGNRKTFTFSAWVKRSSFGRGVLLGASTNVGSQENGIEFDGNIIRCYEYTGSFPFRLETTARYRDPSAWMHVVFALDTTQASSGNRAKLYVNGEQVTDLNANEQPSQNHDSAYLNTTTEQRIGQLAGSHDFDGYMAEINFIDGFQYDPSYFGETDQLTGQWIPKKYTGSYGTNGFYLNFSDNSGTTATTLGKDSSGNGNNFTPNNFSVSAGAGNDSLEDTPTNNFCTLNPLASIHTGNVTTSNGNLDASFGTVSGGGGIASSFVVRTGKWYWETTITAVSGASIHIGILDENIAPFAGSPFYEPGVTAESYAYQNNGTKYNNNTNTSYGATYTTNDVIGIALDLDNGTITFYKNNSSQGQAFSGLTGGFSPAYGDGSSAGTHSISANFGQRAFSYTPPTGFKKLNSANLPDPTIKLPNNHFDILLYTGNDTTNNITGLNFAPDFVWIKNRSNAGHHLAMDTVRGLNNLLPNLANTESSNGSKHIQTFNSDGFTLAGSGGNSNDDGNTYVAWNWNAGSSTVTNTDGTISSQVRASTTAGFSIVTYTGTASNATVGHGLGVKPDCVILKRRTGGDSDWFVFHKDIGNTKNIRLNSDNSVFTTANIWNNTDPTSSAVNIGTSSGVNGNGSTYVMYCFSKVAGYSKFGSYEANNSTDGPFVYLGFEPKWVLIKPIDNSGSWQLYDNERTPVNKDDGNALYPAISNAEGSGFSMFDFLSNGFKLRNSGSGGINYQNTYIYLAFAEAPFKYARAR